MSRKRRTVQEVREVLDRVAPREPPEDDEQPASRVGRYAWHGKPCCLVGEMLHEMGFSIGYLKALDRADEGDPILLSATDLTTRFEPLAFELMCYLQKLNDYNMRWMDVRKAALTLDPYWARFRVRRYSDKPWLAETPALNAAEFKE